MKNYLIDLEKNSGGLFVRAGNYLDSQKADSCDSAIEEKSICEEGFSYSFSLSADKDIFSEISNDIMSDEETSEFLLIFKKFYLEIQNSYSDTVFPKLHALRESDGAIEIDWIFNYFRAYFSFDSNEGSYGMVEDNPEKHLFSSYSKILRKHNFEEAIFEVFSFVIERV